VKRLLRLIKEAEPVLKMDRAELDLRAISR